ncbi:MAG: riboflavin biosynthesis protein RibF [Candidatus Latescibacteria bacterium]|nr:riboflavin biosynthesis protein RibF [Candidatus Latescibacterota bacterium]
MATLGAFDGVHLGHQRMLGDLLDRARSSDVSSAVITLDPHPRVFFNGPAEKFLITEPREQEEAIAAEGVDRLVALPFREVANMTAADFFSEVLKRRMAISHLVVGHDQRFGSDQIGDSEQLAAIAGAVGISISTVRPVVSDGEVVSSTLIRRWVAESRFDLATAAIGRPFELSGDVVYGDARGRGLGYPTANIKPAHPLKLIPPHGIYVAHTELDRNLYPVMLYIGTRGTFGLSEPTVEAAILDYSGALYGSNISVGITTKIREDIVFDSPEALKHQIGRDEVATREVWEELGNS